MNILRKLLAVDLRLGDHPPHHRPDGLRPHSIFYTSDVDTIEIKHTAYNRDGFALGSIIAAEWLVGKKGVFTMRDVLELTK